jgi:hypothetical protein
MPKGGVTNGIVPPYPMALFCEPTRGFTYETASFWDKPVAAPIASKTIAGTNLFIRGNCRLLHG